MAAPVGAPGSSGGGGGDDGSSGVPLPPPPASTQFRRETPAAPGSGSGRGTDLASLAVPPSPPASGAQPKVDARACICTCCNSSCHMSAINGVVQSCLSRLVCSWSCPIRRPTRTQLNLRYPRYYWRRQPQATVGMPNWAVAVVAVVGVLLLTGVGVAVMLLIKSAGLTMLGGATAASATATTASRVAAAAAAGGGNAFATGASASAPGAVVMNSSPLFEADAAAGNAAPGVVGEGVGTNVAEIRPVVL